MQAELNMSARQEDREGDLRARELFHYFQPDNPALMPSGQRDNRPCESPTAEKQSPNLVLTALAQLAALKLGVQRAVIRYVLSASPRTQDFPSIAPICSTTQRTLWIPC
jgi:hypothetical protein